MATPSWVLNDLMTLLGAPASVGVERPMLAHFSSAAQAETVAATAASAGRPASARVPGGPLTGTLVLTGSVLAAAALALLGGAVRPRRRRIGLALLPVAVVLGGAAVLASNHPAAVHSAPAAAQLSSGPAAAAVPLAAHTPTSAGWQLLGRVAAFETTIAQEEAAVRRAAPPQPPATVVGQAIEGAPAPAAATGAQRAAAISLEATLQQEYDFFAAIVADPAQASALLAAAAAQPRAVTDAITYDVGAVQASLAQQAAISQAAAISPGEAAAAAPAQPAGAAGTAPALLVPLAGSVTQGFGPSSLAFEPAVRLGSVLFPHFHTGLDIAAPFDTPVRSAAIGVVALAGSETDGAGHLVGYGNYVVVAHGGGAVTLYGHLDRLLVGVGQAVHGGDPLGMEGSSGNSTGPHLHFELRVGGQPTNPLPYLTAQ